MRCEKCDIDAANDIYKICFSCKKINGPNFLGYKVRWACKVCGEIYEENQTECIKCSK